MLTLQESDMLLYEDICKENDINPDIMSLTKRQVELIISLRMNGVSSEYTPSGVRRWKVQGK
jgi:hypothetical protein